MSKQFVRGDSVTTLSACRIVDFQLLFILYTHKQQIGAITYFNLSSQHNETTCMLFCHMECDLVNSIIHIQGSFADKYVLHYLSYMLTK